MERLDKILSDSGVGSRKDIKKMISEGRVFVNGAVAVHCDVKLDRETAAVTLDGRAVNISRFRYFAMNKPEGVLTATTDRNQPTVLDLLKESEKRLGLFPVGRLDKDTTGLLLLTNDGNFAHRVISPNAEIDKTYIAQVGGVPDERDILQFAQGLILADGTECQPALLEYLGEHICRITIHEGKYHQVKRMMAAVGKPVLTLRRISIGNFTIDNTMKSGEYRELTKEDLCNIVIDKNV